MKDRKLATRYARALITSLPDPQAAETADKFLAALRVATEESDEFRDLMIDPSVPRETRRSVLRSLAQNNDMPLSVINFMDAIVDHNRTSSLASIAEVYHEEREEREGIIPAEITTATPLSEDLKQRTLRAIEKMTGRSVRLTARVEPDLIGGAVTRVGTKVYDGSLRTQINELRRRMIQE